MILSQNQIPFVRLASQQLIKSRGETPKDVVSWMGAIQAQDFPMAKWAIGTRLTGSSDQAIEAALNHGSILRTHLLRPTWHFVAPEDIHWMIDLTANQIRSAMSYRDKALELTDSVYSKSLAIIEKTLEGGVHLPREALMKALKDANIPTDQNRASHLFMRAEIEKIICSGRINNSKQTYTLLSGWVKQGKHLAKDKALATLAKRYFTSRCPATTKDFSWWSGLPAGDVRQAMESVKSDCVAEQIQGQTYWVPPTFKVIAPERSIVHVLPTYDEFTLSYVDRRASISEGLEAHLKEISNRGVFWPIISMNGQVIGTWNRKIKKEAVMVNIQLFTHLIGNSHELIEEAFARYGEFCDKKVIVTLVDQ